MLKIGHRGAQGHALENTLASFQKAIELGVDMVEFDIRITKDKYPVIVHSAALKKLVKKTGHKSGRVKNLTLAELKKLKVGGKEPIPTLGEVLELVSGKIGINLELKVKHSAQIVVQTLRDYKFNFKHVLLSSNHPGEIKEAERLEPGLKTALVFRSVNAFSFWFFLDFLAILLWPITKHYITWLVRHANADYININHRILTKEKVKLFKKQGIKICAWTVNNQKKINHLKSLGVDAIITNYPDRL